MLWVGIDQEVIVEMDLNKKMRVMKIVMFLSLLIMFFILLTVKTNSCLKCEFDYEGENYDFKEFLDIYEGECLEEKSEGELLDDLNLSFSPNN